ncbi:cathepsin 7-like [Sigmodon hispidus]
MAHRKQPTPTPPGQHSAETKRAVVNKNEPQHPGRWRKTKSCHPLAKTQTGDWRGSRLDVWCARQEFRVQDMISAIFLAILCLGVASASPTQDCSLDAEWEEWKMSYGKIYSHEEERQKRAVWEENVRMIKLHSEENGLGMINFTVEMDEFADMTGEEMRKMMAEGSVLTLRKGRHNQKRGKTSIPKSLDWRTKGMVVVLVGLLLRLLLLKDSCSTNRKTDPPSVQNIIDCSRPLGTHGCKGGKISSAFQYVKYNGGLEAASTYPYEAKVGPCRYSPEKSVVKITRFVAVSRNEEALTML